MKTEILQEDNDLLVVYKPAGLATQTARVGQQDVVSELKSYLRRTQTGIKTLPGSGTGSRDTGPYLGVVHRLDQPVEGLLVFAKNKKTAASLTGQLRNSGSCEEKLFCKYYKAVVCGLPDEKQGRLVNYLFKDKDNRAVILERVPETAGKNSKDIQKAVLQYTILQKRNEEGIALADILLETGRFHQIRAQMAHGGMPLLGDIKYGNRESMEKSESLQVQNVALCACSLEFVHPVSKEKMSIQVSPRGKVFSLFSQL